MNESLSWLKIEENDIRKKFIKSKEMKMILEPEEVANINASKNKHFILIRDNDSLAIIFLSTFLFRRT